MVWVARCGAWGQAKGRVLQRSRDFLEPLTGLVHKSGCGCTVGRDFTPRGGVRRKRCRERQVQKKVLNRVPLRGIKRRKPTITSGNEEAGITAAPTDTER